MLTAKIARMGIIIIDNRTSKPVRTIDCSRYAGVKSVNVSEGNITAVCKDGRTRIFDIKTGGLKRTI